MKAMEESVTKFTEICQKPFKMTKVSPDTNAAVSTVLEVLKPSTPTIPKKNEDEWLRGRDGRDTEASEAVQKNLQRENISKNIAKRKPPTGGSEKSSGSGSVAVNATQGSIGLQKLRNQKTKETSSFFS